MVTCTCKWSEADCRSTVAKPSTVKGSEHGRVKQFDDAKGYGFISRENGEELFVHFSQIQMDGFRSLAEGKCVTFDVKNGPRGLVAETIRFC